MHFCPQYQQTKLQQTYEPTKGKLDDDSDSYSLINLLVTALSGAYIVNTTFCGAWDEDLCRCLGVFEIQTDICGVGEPDKSLALPVMLSVNALSICSRVSF